MTKKQISELEDHIVNCQILHLAIETLEKMRHTDLPDDLPNRWIDEMKEEAGFQVSHHDEKREIYLENVKDLARRAQDSE